MNGLHEPAQMRVLGMPREAFDPLFAYPDASAIKAHPRYADAKRGDPVAAMDLVLDIMPAGLIKSAAEQIEPDTWFIPAFSRERDGHNAIPVAMANVLADAAGGRVWTDVVQVHAAHHTGADPMERLVSRPAFDGRAPEGGRCVIVDDVTTMGGTLADLADHLLVRDAQRVIGSVLLASASRSGTIHPPQNLVGRLNDRLGEVIRDEFRIEPAALTADEARYLIGFRGPEELRGRANKARAEIDQRRMCRPDQSAPEAPKRRARLRPFA